MHVIFKASVPWIVSLFSFPVETIGRTSLLIKNKKDRSEDPDSDPKSPPPEPEVLWRFAHLWFQQLLGMAHLLASDSIDLMKAMEEMVDSGSYNLAISFVYGLAFNKKDNAVRYIADSVRGQIKQKTEKTQRKIREVLQSIALVGELWYFFPPGTLIVRKFSDVWSIVIMFSRLLLLVEDISDKTQGLNFQRET